MVTGASAGPNTRAHLEMWVLDKHLAKGLQPLGEQVFEGIAVSRRKNLIAWSVIEPELGPDENWQAGFARPTKRYMAEIAERDGRAVLVGKHEILSSLPKDCLFIEPQDFRAGDGELVYSCMGVGADRIPVGRDHHSFDDVAQLAHVVAMPVVTHECLEDSTVEAFATHAEARARGRQEVIRKLRNVGRALAERGTRTMCTLSR